MNGVYPGRGAKAYAPLRASPQCVKRSRTTCTASSQCVKRLCNTCAAPSQCAKRLCNTCAAPSQCAKRLCNTCTAPSQCVKRLCNTCTALSQCAPLPRGQSFIPAGCLGGVCNSPPTCIRQTSLPPQGPPLPGYNHLAPGYPANFAAPADALPPPQLLGIVNA